MNADEQIKSFIDRILRCREAEDLAKQDTKEVYAELAAAGYEKSVVGQVVTYLRKREKDGDKLDEQSAKFDLYLEAYERPSHAHTRVGTENGYANAKLVATVATAMTTEIGRKALGAAVDVMIAREEVEEQNTPSDAAPRLDNTVSPDSAGEADAPTSSFPTNSADGRPEGQAMASLEPHEMDRYAVTAGETATNLPEEVNETVGGFPVAAAPTNAEKTGENVFDNDVTAGELAPMVDHEGDLAEATIEGQPSATVALTVQHDGVNVSGPEREGVTDRRDDHLISPEEAEQMARYTTRGNGSSPAAFVSSPATGGEDVADAENAQPDNGPGFVNTSRAKTIRDYRPNCLKPEACASNFIDRHCYSCERVSRNEVDA